ncbi:MAG: GtrA family protein, partial [Pseudomonadota bacterium]
DETDSGSRGAPRRSPAARGVRYLAVAAFCAGLHNAIMIALDFANVYYGLSLIVSAAVLIPTGFFLQATFTFSADLTWRAFYRYAAVMIVNTPLSFVFLWALYDRLSLPMVVAAPLATIILLIWNFLASGWAVRRRPALKETAR